MTEPKIKRLKVALGCLLLLPLLALAAAPEKGELYLLSQPQPSHQAWYEALVPAGLWAPEKGWQGGKAGVVSLGFGFHSRMPLKEQINQRIQAQRQAREMGGRLVWVPDARDLALLQGQFAGLSAIERQWLQQQPVVYRHNKQLFAAAGLSPALNTSSLEELNQRLWQPNGQGPLGNLLAPDSPVNARALQLCHPYNYGARLKSLLAGLNADRLWVKGEYDQGLQHRLDGRLMLLSGSTPQLVGVKTNAKGNWLSPQQAVPAPARHYPRSHGLSDSEVEAFLQTAPVVEQTRLNVGITNPFKLVMEKDGIRLKGIFKYLDSHPRNQTGHWDRRDSKADRYQYEMAAYKLDRMLGTNLVPVTVERKVNGKTGIVQEWVEGLISEMDQRKQKIKPNWLCDRKAQNHLLRSFDYLIHNTDRNQSNTLYSRDSWQIWFIDQSRAFAVTTGRPKMLKKVRIEVPPGFRLALERLTLKQFKTLRPWLHRKQVVALWKRRNRMLDNNF